MAGRGLVTCGLLDPGRARAPQAPKAEPASGVLITADGRPARMRGGIGSGL